MNHIEANVLGVVFVVALKFKFSLGERKNPKRLKVILKC